jgi:hypothetical protein
MTYLWSVLTVTPESHPCGGGVNYLHRDPALKSETVKYVHESQGTRTRENLCWRRPAAYIKDRRNQNRNSQTIINIWTLAPDGARHQDVLLDWPSIAMWLWIYFDLESIWPSRHQSACPTRKWLCTERGLEEQSWTSFKRECTRRSPVTVRPVEHLLSSSLSPVSVVHRTSMWIFTQVLCFDIIYILYKNTCT